MLNILFLKKTGYIIKINVSLEKKKNHSNSDSGLNHKTVNNFTISACKL